MTWKEILKEAKARRLPEATGEVETPHSPQPPKGLPFNDEDLRKIVNTAEQLGMPDERLAQALGVDMSEIGAIRSEAKKGPAK